MEIKTVHTFKHLSKIPNQNTLFKQANIKADEKGNIPENRVINK